MRPSIRVTATAFQVRQTVSGDRVCTADVTWYRNGKRFLPPHREILWVQTAVHDG